ncbi:MAG: hypothetical protein MZV63_47210 [Marinilabiliales bacterium]|nr:hypothetical protein [Marinilabiliales bacterium]
MPPRANILCFGGNNGMIILPSPEALAPYLYAWTASGGGSGTHRPALQNQSGLTAGTYDLTVTDANGCQTTGSWTLTQPTARWWLPHTTNDDLIGTCSKRSAQHCRIRRCDACRRISLQLVAGGRSQRSQYCQSGCHTCLNNDLYRHRHRRQRLYQDKLRHHQCGSGAYGSGICR